MFYRLKKYLLESNITALENKSTLTPNEAQTLDNMAKYRRVLEKENPNR